MAGGPWGRVAAVVALLVVAVSASPAALAQPEATLEGRAVLPADTFAEGPSSGADLEDETKGGREPPFEGQPVGGVSAVLDVGDGKYKAMPDNGFGKKGNSSDFLLRVYSIRPDFETTEGSSGEITFGEFVQLRDPDRRIPFEITNEDSEGRLLTGADFDIESVRQDPQGDLWFGDEFGPFLLHTDATGRVLEAPIPLPDVKSPENPTLESGEEPGLPTSKGFEGMAISTDGTTLYPMLEGALEGDEGDRRFIYEFDPGSRSYTGERWRYRTEAAEYSIGGPDGVRRRALPGDRARQRAGRRGTLQEGVPRGPEPHRLRRVPGQKGGSGSALGPGPRFDLVART